MTRLVALVLAAVTLAVTGCSSDGSSSSPPAAGPSLVHTAFHCPAPQAAPASDGGSDSLPGGARAAVLCVHDNHDGWAPPHDRLTTDLDGLVRIVNTQQVQHPKADEGCGGVGAPAWSLVLRYDDGTRTISGDNGGCWDLLVGDTQRGGSARVFDAYLQALLRQRREQGSPDVAYPTPRCPRRVRPDTGTYSPLADAGRLTSARLCPAQVTRDDRPVLLTREQVGMVRHDAATATTRRTPADAACHALPRGLGGAVVGVDAWGDPVTVLISCDTYRTVQPGDNRYLFARMLPSTARMLGGLLES